MSLCQLTSQVGHPKKELKFAENNGGVLTVWLAFCRTRGLQQADAS